MGIMISPPLSPADLTPQVATDTRLWLYGFLKVIRACLHDLLKVAADRAEAEVDVLMPGEQPSNLQHLHGCMQTNQCPYQSVCNPC